MADPTPTRQEVVEANIEACENAYGPENVDRLIAVCLKDISVSLAMLVDGSAE